MSETVEVMKKIGINFYPVRAVREKGDDGNVIKCPTLAFVHVKMDTAYGTLIIRGFRVLRGKNGEPFVARPGRTRQLFDENGKAVSTQRFNDVVIEGDGDLAFANAIKEAVMKAYDKKEHAGVVEATEVVEADDVE